MSSVFDSLGSHMDHYVTYQGQSEAIRNALLLGGTIDEMTANVMNAISDYKSQYSYKCNQSFCPLKVDGRVPGFVSNEELELHRVRDHTNHRVYKLSYTILGTPRFECSCGHNDYLTEDEENMDWWTKDFVCQSRLQHLTAVQHYATVSA